ncbi:hypothetical protein AMAG_20774, partial [Allomyces macrogynus ATCC 38327]
PRTAPGRSPASRRRGAGLARIDGGPSSRSPSSPLLIGAAALGVAYLSRSHQQRNYQSTTTTHAPTQARLLASKRRRRRFCARAAPLWCRQVVLPRPRAAHGRSRNPSLRIAAPAHEPVPGLASVAAHLPNMVAQRAVTRGDWVTGTAANHARRC